MSSTPSLLSRLYCLPNFTSFSITNGHSCHVVGKGKAKPTSSPTLFNALYVPNFPLHLLSICSITQALFFPLTFFPYHFIFLGFVDGEEDCFGVRDWTWYLRGCSKLSSSQSFLPFVHSNSPLQWHHWLGPDVSFSCVVKT